MRVLDLISSIMSSPVQVVGPTDSLSHARNLMLREKINRIIVVDEEARPIGILTRGDVARAVSSRDPGPTGSFDQVLVREVMSKTPLSLKPNDTVLSAAQVMVRKGISGLPIVDEDGLLVGILSSSDVTKYYAEHCEGRVRINEVDTHPATTIPSTYSLYRAEELMLKQKIGRLVVVNGAAPIGIITQRDLSFASFSSRGPLDKFRRTRNTDEGEEVRTVRLPEETTVESVMSAPPVVIQGGQFVASAARLMIERRIGGVPVVGLENNLTGIVTKTDVAKALIIYHSRSSSSLKKG